MDFFLTQEELAARKYINFTVDLSETGLLISSCPQDLSTIPAILTPNTGLLADLNHLSWKELDVIGRNGKAHQQIALGAVKTDHMKNGYNAEYRIIGFDHDDLADGSGKAPFTWEMVRVYKDSHSMNADCPNKGGWNACDARKWLNSEFFALCSDELQSVIRPVVKLTSAGEKSKEIIKSIDRVFILSEKEVFGRITYSAPGEGTWYEYYRLEDVPYYALDDDGDRRYKSLRSAIYTSYDDFCTVNTDGSAGTTNAWYAGALAPGFSF